MALLAEADLSYANLGGAVFDHADLAGVSLRGAILDGARLELAQNLTQTQIDAALGDADTVLPADLQVPATWLAFDYLAGMDLSPDVDDDFFDAEPHEVLGLAPKASAEEIRRA
jgi:poly-gamma-glutamate capsule biosynthesis protein CapA/YwtB (metallophosphatase superfamily)